MNNNKIIIFVYDITRYISLEHLNSYYTEIIQIKRNKEIIVNIT